MDEKRRGLDAIRGIADGLKDVLEKLADVAESAESVERHGGVGDGKSHAGVYGFRVRFGGSKEPASGPLGAARPRGAGIKVEPFGNLKRDAEGQTRVSDEREPLVDLFEEADRVLLVVEMPGADPDTVSVRLTGDMLELSASGGGRRYRSEQLLPQAFSQDALHTRYANGILEISLTR